MRTRVILQAAVLLCCAVTTAAGAGHALADDDASQPVYTCQEVHKGEDQGLVALECRIGDESSPAAAGPGTIVKGEQKWECESVTGGDTAAPSAYVGTSCEEK